MNKEVDTYKIFRQLEERRKRRNPYTFYDRDELVDEILKLEDNLDQLTNNWNELEEDINNQLMMTRKFDDYNEGYFDATLHYYNKMKEIKEKNNE